MLSPVTLSSYIIKSVTMWFISIKFQMLPNCTPECVFILKKNRTVKILVCTANLFEN